MLIYRYCAVTLLKTMRTIRWDIYVEVLSTIISEFKLCVALQCDLQFYLLTDSQNWMFPIWEVFLSAGSDPVGTACLESLMI
jgi:hypothetical protein